MSRPSVRVAAVQPRSATGPDEEGNVLDALEWIAKAADAGAELVVFPEGYPGPTTPANTYDAFERLAGRAKECGVHVIAGSIEADDAAGGYYVVLKLIGDDGELIGTYRRLTPPGPYVYHDIPAWKFDYVAASDPLQVYETKIGRIGLQVCSEVYSPEQSRVLALQGADIIVYPAGGAIEELCPPWRAMIWARAIENLVYTVAVQNLYGGDTDAVGTIAAPEEILAQEPGEGLLIADLDLGRLDFLRTEEERIEVPRTCRTVPGLLNWRRPHVTRQLAELEETTKTA
jgi:predicted amidohydrolase